MSADLAPTADARGPTWGAVHLAAAAIIAALLLAPVPGRFAAPWIGCLQDLSHVPLMAVVAWLVQRVTGAGNLLAATATLGVAAAFELLQSLGLRSFSPSAWREAFATRASWQGSWIGLSLVWYRGSDRKVVQRPRPASSGRAGGRSSKR